MARVLVADDEPGIREILRATCALDGHEVVAAGNAEQALAAYDEATPDLMILDVNMPGGGAQDVLAELGRRPGGVGCPVLLMSGFAAEELEDLPVAGVIQKPFTIDAVRMAVKAALAGG